MGLTKPTVVDVLRTLTASEQVELDERGAVIGSRGLTLTPTVHRLVLASVGLHTWCALDAIGIPAALAADAQIDKLCGYCSDALHVDVDRGEPRAQAGFALWLPTGPCHNLRTDFCALANLLCSSEHVDQWRTHDGDATDEPLDVEAAARLGRLWWAARTDQHADP